MLTPEGANQQWVTITHQPSDTIDNLVKPRRVFQPLYGESGDFAYLSDKVNQLESQLAELKEKTIYGKYQKLVALYNAHINPKIYLGHMKSVFTIAKFWFDGKLKEANGRPVTSGAYSDQDPYAYSNYNIYADYSLNYIDPKPAKVHKKNCPKRNK